MANLSDHIFKAVSDKLILGLAVLLAFAGIAAFYFLGDQKEYLRIASLVLGMGLGSVLALWSQVGKKFISFAKDSYRELRKVVWPTRKETGQTTLIVFGFVLVMAVYLWIGDKAIEWLVFSLILRWK